MCFPLKLLNLFGIMIATYYQYDAHNPMFLDLKSIAQEPAQRALAFGGNLAKLRYGFFSGGHSYTHLLTTKRGTQYRVSNCIAKVLVIPAGTEIPVIG